MALHCPATLLLAPAPADAQGVAALAVALTGERVLGVVGAPGEEAACRLAETLGVPLEAEAALAEGEPTSSALGAIADLHRGETVVVLARSVGAGERPFDRLELD